MSDLVHVYPLSDLRDHRLSADCWCKPELDEGVVIHNAMDRRELYETGERKAS